MDAAGEVLTPSPSRGSAAPGTLPAVPRSGHPSRLAAVVVGLGLLVVVVWAVDRPWQRRPVDGVASWLGAMSTLTAATGVLLMGVTIVLSARFAAVESLTGGLDKVYRQHHLYGSLAFTVLLVHPALLTWERAQLSIARAARLWRPTADVGLLTGQLAMALMIPAMVVTVFVTVRHQRLVLVQRLLGLLVLPMAVHAVDGTTDPMLRALMIAVLGAAVLALAKHTMLGRRLDRHAPYRVTEVRELGSGLVSLSLAPVGRAMRFVPGQFAYLRLTDAAVTSEPHPFSIASDPGATGIRFVVKELGDWTAGIDAVEPGAAAVVEGPYGRFSHRFVKGRSQLWVAGGVGITPFLSMAASLAPRGCPYDVDLVWCTPTTETAPFLAEELRALAADRPHLRVHLRADDVDGLVTADALAELCEAAPGRPITEREILLCGPEAMRDALTDGLTSLGVVHRRIHEEGFRYR